MVILLYLGSKHTCSLLYQQKIFSLLTWEQIWSGICPANAKGVTILVKGEKLLLVDMVQINNVCIKRNIFINQTLSWSESGGRPSNAEVNLQVKLVWFIVLVAYWRDSSSKPSQPILIARIVLHLCQTRRKVYWVQSKSNNVDLNIKKALDLLKGNMAVTFITVVIKIIITLLPFLKEIPTIKIEADSIQLGKMQMMLQRDKYKLKRMSAT